ncbi:MAG: hypothetical protein HOH74_19155, partial [Gemmatimonadetes bacterium]|nr:hypothetical protein [Gemmatimonadota bacterium]
MILLTLCRALPLILLTCSILLPGAAWAAGSDAERRSLFGGQTIGVGIADFEHSGYGADGIATAARGIVEQELTSQPGIVLIERSRLASLLEEISFQQSGITQPEGAAEAGLSGNVQLLLFGQVARSATGEFRLALRIVDVATG